MIGLSDQAFQKRALRLEWLLFDVDGVLTDGRLVYSGDGETLKLFHAHDGLALKMARRAGLRTGFLSGRRSAPLERRARDLDVDAVILGSRDKRADFDRFLREHDAEAERVAYVGDDLPDLGVLGRCGLSFAPADAAHEVRAAADRVLEARGGYGAAREMIELVLKARGDWDDLVAGYLPAL